MQFSDADPRRVIRAAALIRALESHVLDGAEMKPTQVSAALALLKKVLPDLGSSAAASGNNDEGAHEAALRELE